MNTQYKKGVLELVVLLCLKKNDLYGYELVKQVSQVIEVNEGTIYPLLKRLTNEKYCTTYLKESQDGPPRKYYHLSVLGEEALNTQLTEWLNFVEKVNEFVKGDSVHE